MPETPRRPGPEPGGDEKPAPLAVALGAGTEFAATILAALGLGWWLDGRLRTGPWLTLLGAMAGMALALYRLIRLSRIKPGGR